ncbi:MAG: RNA polymerase sigma factor [Bacteroidetes bacterium]|nr:RNA polymerase sigma factor [Bacteroidota bacterium]
MGFFKKTYRLLSDEDLMLDISKGNHAAFTELYERYSKVLYQFFFVRMWKDSEKAEDFVQDLMTKLIQNPKSFDLSRSFKTWIFSIANNMVKNEYKKQAVRSGMHSFDADAMAYSISADSEEKKVEDALFKEAFDKQLNVLDIKHREVFELRHVLGFSNKEIAELMEINEGTVKSRVFYAIKELSQLLNEYKPSY